MRYCFTGNNFQFSTFNFQFLVPALAVEYILHPEGRTRFQTNGTPIYEYHLKDHLGNVRVAFEIDADGHAAPFQWNDYDPFGMVQENDYTFTATGATDGQLYKYNGKEEQNFGLNAWLDYGWRMYNPALGRWHNVDPLAEMYANYSPYNYCLNNPENIIDPDGMTTEQWMKDNGVTQDDLITIYEAPSTGESNSNSDNNSSGNNTGEPNQQGSFGGGQDAGGGKDDGGSKNQTNDNNSNNNNTGGSGKSNTLSKTLAKTINSLPPMLGNIPNPFYGAGAISIDGGGSLVGAEDDYGLILMLRGPNRGQYVLYSENAAGGGSSVSVDGEITRYDYSKGNKNIRIDMLSGERHKVAASIGGGWFSVGLAATYSVPKQGGFVIGSTIQGGFGATIFNILYNFGSVEFMK